MNIKRATSLLDLTFFMSSSVILAGSFVVNVLNYVFTLIISRMLGVEAFGEVTALFSLLLIVSVPASALSMLMTQQTAAFRVQGDDTIRALFVGFQKNVAVASVIFWLVFLCTVPFLARFLVIDIVPLLIFSILIPITLASALQSGTLQGLQEFFMLSKQSVLSTVIKLFVSLALVQLGFSVIGVMTGLVLAQLAAWGYGYRATHTILVARDHGAPVVPDVSLQTSRGLFSAILVTTLLLALLSNIDVLMAKHFLPADLAGQYGALSTVGKILIYGVGAFITVLLPMVSAAHAKSAGQGTKILALSLGVITLSSVVIYTAFALYPEAIISALLGARYAVIAPYLAHFSIAMACISLSTALINYFVALQNTSFVYFLASGIMLEMFLITMSHASVAGITLALVGSSVVMLVLMVLNYAFFCRTISL